MQKPLNSKIINTNENLRENKFKRSANRGDDKMIDIICNLGLNVETSNDSYSVYDGIVKDENEKYLIETKHRARKFDDYVLENKKINNLYKEAKELKCDGILYLNTFNDGSAVIWNVTNKLLDKSKKGTLWCNKHTAINSGKINKKVYYLNPIDGLQIPSNHKTL